MLKGRKGSILQSGREISRQELDEIQETVGVFPLLSRTELWLQPYANIWDG